VDPALDERNRLILRRTLSVISQFYAVWSGLLALMFLTLPSVGQGLYASRTYGAFMAAHAGLLAGAGWALWKPRPGAWVAVALAAAGSAFFTVVDLGRPNWQNAALDALYPAVAAAIFVKVLRKPRRRFLNS